MNYRLILKSLGNLLCVEAVCMLPSFLIALIYGGREDSLAFLSAFLITGFLGLIMRQAKGDKQQLFARDGFAIVSFGWFLVSLFGALPFFLSGALPSFVDAFFESVAGFSTTGASILANIELLPKSLSFWRACCHWLGGMGVLVLMLAIIPSVKGSTMHIIRAESPGPEPLKLVPRIRQTAKILYLIYIGLTASQFVLLLFGGMGPFDALIHAFGTTSTGGVSSKALSIAAYDSVYIEMIVLLFMILSGVNFTLHYSVLKGKIRTALKDEELRFYLVTVLVGIVLISLNLNTSVYDNLGQSFRYASFQVGSIVTTTAFTSANFALWPLFSRWLIFILMFFGASAGSTSGSLKCVRILLLLKIVRREIAKIIHPNSIQTVKLNGKVVSEEILSGVSVFFFAFFSIFAVSTLVVSLDNKDMLSSATAVLSSINNIGIGFGDVGPGGSFAGFSILSKLVFSFCMIAGRLEIYPVLLLFAPTFWKRVNI